jgi:hypothetical protein
VSPNTVKAGDKVTVSGNCWKPGSYVALVVKTKKVQLLGIAKVGPNGSFSIKVQIPSNLATGQHKIYAIGLGANGKLRIDSALITVTGGCRSDYKHHCDSDSPWDDKVDGSTRTSNGSSPGYQLARFVRPQSQAGLTMLALAVGLGLFALGLVVPTRRRRA